MHRMYGVVRKEWDPAKTKYLLRWLYGFYLREHKPMVLTGKTGTTAKQDKANAIEHIDKMYRVHEEIRNHDDKEALFDQAMDLHNKEIVGTAPVDPPQNVVRAIDHLAVVIKKLDALGQSHIAALLLSSLLCIDFDRGLCEVET
jgi:hypothetical protein